MKRCSAHKRGEECEKMHRIVLRENLTREMQWYGHEVYIQIQMLSIENNSCDLMECKASPNSFANAFDEMD